MPVVDDPGDPAPDDRLFDELLEHAILLERLKATQAAAAREKISRLVVEIVAALLLVWKDFRRQPAYYQASYLSRWIVQQQAVITRAYQDLAAGNLADLRRIVEIEQTAARGMLVAAGLAPMGATTTPVNTTATVDPATVSVQGFTPAEWWNSQAVNFGNRVAQQVRVGASLGEDAATVAARIDGEPGGVANGAMRDAASVAALGLATVAGLARQTVFDASGAGSVMHLSVLDGRTTEVCTARAGRRWTLPGHEPIGHDLAFAVPPLHWACRSYLTLLAGDSSPKFPTFIDWLKAREAADPGFAAALLGERRADLILRGVLGASDLVDLNYRALTLDEFEALVRRRYSL